MSHHISWFGLEGGAEGLKLQVDRAKWVSYIFDWAIDQGKMLDE
jgi:hypothetical protein